MSPPSLTPERAKAAEFYSAGSGTIPPLPWQTFPPPFSTGLWKESRETSFYLSNRSITAKQAADAIRKHWGIENGLHYVRDVTLREDASRIRINPGIFARLRSFAYNILRLALIGFRGGEVGMGSASALLV